MLRSLIFAVTFLQLACGVAELASNNPSAEDGITVNAPLSGSGQDEADRSCQLVLRSVARGTGPTGVEADCSSGSCWFVWRGQMDVKSQALSEGGKPWVAFRSTWDGTWHAVEATATSGAGAGQQRYEFRLAQFTAQSGASFTSLQRTRIEIAPYLLTPAGGRLFDHNRNPGDFDNYLLTSDNTWSVGTDAAACANVSRTGTVQFVPGWQQIQRGALAAWRKSSSGVRPGPAHQLPRHP